MEEHKETLEETPLVAGEHSLSEGPWRVAPPRLRIDWESLRQRGRATGRVTAEEILWVVIITMCIAGMRDTVLEDHNLEEYVLHFFVVYGALISSIMYSGRFNDYDAFHSGLWALVLLCLLFMVAGLYHYPWFSVAAATLHLCLAVAYARVALFVERAKYYGVFFGVASVVNAGLLLCAPLNPRIVLWVNVGFDNFVHAIFKLWVILADRVRGDDFGRRRVDIPGDFDYTTARYEGTHMMMIACSFLFPLGLQGAIFVAHRKAALVVVAGSLYALLFKLSFFDAKQYSESERWIHPLKRSRFTSRLFLMGFPLSLLGIAFTGVGYVSAVHDAAEEQPTATYFTRKLLTVGPCLTWATLVLTPVLGVTTACDHVVVMRDLVIKAVLTACFAVTFFWPATASPLGAAIWTAAVQLALLLAHRRGAALHSWKPPRLLKDWDRVDGRIGDRVSSHEHFFTVLVAVGVWSLNAHLERTRDFSLYALQFVSLWAGLAMTMRYAARFNDDDAAHAVLWSTYQFLLLLLLEGLSANPGRRCFDAGVLFQIANSLIFGWLAIGFWGRIVWRLPRARPLSATFLAISIAMAAFSVGAGFARRRILRLAVLVVFSLVVLLTDAGLVALMRLLVRDVPGYDIPLNIEYVISRYQGLFMEVLGVGIIVPNAFYPNDYPHPSLVVAGDACAGIMAVLLKMLLFDSDAPTHEHHAVRISKLRASAFLTLYPFMLLAISYVGGATSILIPRAGNGRPTAIAAVRVLLLAAAMLYFSLTLTKLTHKPRHMHAHYFKAKLTAVASVATALPAVFASHLFERTHQNLAPVLYLTVLTLLVVFGQLLVNKAADDHH